MKLKKYKAFPFAGKNPTASTLDGAMDLVRQFSVGQNAPTHAVERTADAGRASAQDLSPSARAAAAFLSRHSALSQQARRTK